MTAGFNGGANLYAYCANNPIMITDSTGGFWDVFIDLAFVIFDLVVLAIDPSEENLIALGVDIGAMFIPFVTGAGLVVRGGLKIINSVDNVVDVGKTINKLDNAREAFNAAKRSQGIPLSRQADKISRIKMLGANGKIYKARLYEYGNKFVRHDFGGHMFRDGKTIARHFNAGKIVNGKFIGNGMHFWY